MSSQPSPAAGTSPLDFTPVALRPRVDGWTPERQAGFIQALAATGCVDEAARHVGMSARSARALRTRRDSDSLRAACKTARVNGIGRHPAAPTGSPRSTTCSSSRGSFRGQHGQHAGPCPASDNR